MLTPVEQAAEYLRVLDFQRVYSGLYCVWQKKPQTYIGQVQWRLGGWRFRAYKVDEWTYGPLSREEATKALLDAYAVQAKALGWPGVQTEDPQP